MVTTEISIKSNTKVLKDLENFINCHSDSIENSWINNPGSLVGDKGAGCIDVHLRIKVVDFQVKNNSESKKVSP